MSRTVLFLCPHNAAKSVIASALCTREAESHGLDLQARSAGTEPDDAPSPAVVERLAAEGIDVSRHRPRCVTDEDLGLASHVISMGCDISGFVADPPAVEHWDDVPPPSTDLEGAFSTIHDHVIRFLRRETQPM